MGLISKSNSEPLEVKLDSDHSVVNAIKMIENEIMNTFVNHILKCGLKVIEAIYLKGSHFPELIIIVCSSIGQHLQSMNCC